MKLISIVTPCYNEEANVEDLARAVNSVFAGLDGYTHEHIFIDNASTDRTPSILREMAVRDKRVKVILNTKNFGWLRSPYYGLLQGSGAATVYLPADFQEPPEQIPEFIKAWETGHKIVLGVRAKAKEGSLIAAARKAFYFLIRKVAEIEHIDNFHGFGLYDKLFIDTLKRIDAPNPYFRGLVAEFGHDMVKVEYTQIERKGGKTKSNLYLLYDAAMLGFVNHSKVPLRLATLLGFFAALVSFLSGLGYLVYKLLYWDSFELGTAPMVIGLFGFAAVQLVFIGIIGEYIGAIYTQVKNRPLVIEKERINFERAAHEDPSSEL